jgi:hypothetical protein
MSYFEYSVKVYTDESYGGSETRVGIVTGESYCDALEEVMNFYGERFVANVRLESWESEGAVLELTEEAVREIKEDGVYAI